MILGGLYSVLAAVILVARSALRGDLVETTRLWLLASIVYVAGWAAGGSLIGLLVPIGGTRRGRMLIGLVATMPVALSASQLLVYLGLTEQGAVPIGIALAYSVVMGPIFGFLSWFAIGPDVDWEGRFRK